MLMLSRSEVAMTTQLSSESSQTITNGSSSGGDTPKILSGTRYLQSRVTFS